MSNQFLEEMAEQQGVSLPDFRADVPPGTELGEQEIEPGATTRWRKPSSMMRMGDKELPERVALFDLQRHDKSMVPPTIAQRRMVTHPGRFTMKPPTGWTEKQPIDDTCQICLRNREEESPGAGPKKFYSHFDLTSHYRLFHTLEWDAIENDRRDAERREDQSTMRTLVASIAAMVQPSQGARLPEEVRSQIAGLQNLEEVANSVPEAAVDEDLKQYTNRELRQLAANKGLDVSKATNKEQLIAALKGGS